MSDRTMTIMFILGRKIHLQHTSCYHRLEGSKIRTVNESHMRRMNAIPINLNIITINLGLAFIAVMVELWVCAWSWWAVALVSCHWSWGLLAPSQD